MKQKTVKHRGHYALFANNTPFKPKRVVPKNSYRRNDKHRNKER